MFDGEAWTICDPEDLWIFDKLILARKLGYICGPAGVPVPKPDQYIVRPITNIEGMGIGAYFMSLQKQTDMIGPGNFWCEIFRGRHLSVDYADQKQVLCVEGIRDHAADLYRWAMWKRVDDVVPFPEVLYTLKQNYKHINCEFVDGKLIEVHLRPNPDFTGNEKLLRVVWDDMSTTPPEGMEFIEAPDFKRKGFFKPI